MSNLSNNIIENAELTVESLDSLPIQHVDEDSSAINSTVTALNRKRKCDTIPSSQDTKPQGDNNPVPGHESDDLIKTLSMNDSGSIRSINSSFVPQKEAQPFDAAPFLPLRQLRLEAIFYPKFDNERAESGANNGSSIRRQMIERCRAGNGYIEVSLKHSGSLVLWSGHERFYSKNSTANLFTSVAEVLLRQHFQKLSAVLRDEAKLSVTGEDLFEQCSSYIEQHRLTLSFEVITAVLGDHGARPLHDFIILTAIADRNRVTYTDAPTNIFYSTLELIDFAQRFRLPHNDYWIYSDEPSVLALFDVYDNSRETGTTSTVIPALCAAAAVTGRGSIQKAPFSLLLQSNDEIGLMTESNCDFYVQSMYPHADYQGDILEGIVIRFVSINSQENSSVDCSTTLEHVQLLAQRSRKLLQRFKAKVREPPAVYGRTIDLRQIYKDSNAAYSRKGVEDFDKRLTELLFAPSSDHGRPQRRVVQRFVGNAFTSKEVELWIQTLLQQPNIDVETQRIAAIVDSVSKLTSKVVYSVFHEQPRQTDCDVEGKNGNSRYICIVHVLHDETFYKYHRNKRTDALPLFRGFSFQLIGGEMDGDVLRTSDFVGTNESHGIDREIEMDIVEKRRLPENGDESLMLKMKFLPYMIRTFACRNGLKVIRQVDGTTAFTSFTNNLMSKWGISDSVRQEWRPFLSGWARYAQLYLNRNNGGQKSAPEGNTTNIGESLPPLSEYCYIDHFENYQKLYRDGKYNEQVSPSARLQGLVVVVAPNSDRSGVLADYIAQRLGGARRIVGLDDVNTSTVDDACNPGLGIVCSAAIEHGFGKIRKLLKDFADFITIVLFECSEENLLSIEDCEERKKLAGVLKGWKKTTCSRVVELPYSITHDSSHSDEFALFGECDPLNELISQLELPAVADERVGVIVFFPMIPGSGKSTYVSNIQDNMYGSLSNRSLFIHEGDKMQDKNAPCSVWGTIADICANTKALAVPVLPDKATLRTLRVEGYRQRDGTIAANECHVYPFSLWYLAVCIARIMQRPAGSHAGKLDKATKRSCLVVVKFFSFYRSLSTEQFLLSLTSTFANAGALITPFPIEVPFFSIDPCVEDLPDDVELVLLEALRCQFGYDRENLDATSIDDEYLDDLEIRLRDVLDRYRDVILSSTSDVFASRTAFVTSFKEKISEADSIMSYDAPSFVKIASIDVGIDCVYNILRELYKNERVGPFFDRILSGNAIDEILSDSALGKAEDLGFVTKTHVTLAHCRSMSQSCLRSTFTPHLESTVELSANALLWNDRVMALAVNVSEITSEGNILPASINEFVHLTVWIDKDASAVEANNLPKLVDADEAYRVGFPSYSLQGVVSLWNL